LSHLADNVVETSDMQSCGKVIETQSGRFITCAGFYHRDTDQGSGVKIAAGFSLACLEASKAEARIAQCKGSKSAVTSSYGG
jgi:hypothetical protein